MMFVKVPIVLKKNAQGSEDGIHIKNFQASEEPQLVEESLAKVFVGSGIAEYFKEKTVEKKVEQSVKPEETKPLNKKFETR